MSVSENGTEIKKPNLAENTGGVEEDKSHEEQIKKHEENLPPIPSENKENPDSDTRPPEDIKPRKNSSSSSSSLPRAEDPVLQEEKIVPQENKNYKQQIVDYYSKAKEVVLEKKVQVGVLAATVGGVIAIAALRKWRKRS